MAELGRDAAALGAAGSDDELGPGQDGLGLLAQVARQAPEALRILVSANCEASRIDEALGDGTAHQFLAKPWPAGEVVAALQRSSRSGSAPILHDGTSKAAK